MPNNFWMINCNRQNFDITRDRGFSHQGLKAEHRRKVRRVEPGDRVIFYVSGDRVFAATATVTQSYEEVRAGPWIKEGKAGWPFRIGIKPDVVLNPEQYIDAGLIAYRLEYLRKWPPEDWHLAFQGNLHLLSKNDFFLLETEMLKLRYGREEAFRRIDAELAADVERFNAQRERRRRNSERDSARANANGPPDGRNPYPSDDEPQDPTQDNPPAPPTRLPPRGRRPQPRSDDREPTPKSQRFDND